MRKHLLRKEDPIKKYIILFTENCITLEVELHDVLRQIIHLDTLQYVKAYHVFYADNVNNDIIITKPQIQFLRYQGVLPKAC